MNEHVNELQIDSPEFTKFLYSVINQRVDYVVKNLKFNKTYSATIVAVNTGNVDIRLQGGTNTILSVPDKTGVTLVIGDEVYVEAINNSLNNLVIKYKK